MGGEGVGDGGELLERESESGVHGHPSEEGEHGNAAVLDLRLSHPLEGGDGSALGGLQPDVRHNLLTPVFLREKNKLL